MENAADPIENRQTVTFIIMECAPRIGKFYLWRQRRIFGAAAFAKIFL
jgi:hypothetical protein